MKKVNRLTKAFSILRKKGWFAKQNFWCCQSCGFAAIPEGTTNCVFYHNQDKTRLNENNSTYLSYDGNTTELVEVLKNVGLEVEWDGNTNKRILVKEVYVDAS
jgi:hypothetical protein